MTTKRIEVMVHRRASPMGDVQMKSLAPFTAAKLVMAASTHHDGPGVRAPIRARGTDTPEHTVGDLSLYAVCGQLV